MTAIVNGSSSDKYRALYFERSECIDREQNRSKTIKGGLDLFGIPITMVVPAYVWR